MSTLKALRTRIQSIKATQKITTAMKLVSAAKLRRAQDRLVHVQHYDDHFHNTWNQVVRAAYFQDLPFWLTQKKNAPKKLMIVIMGDRGLCGSYNANMLRFVKQNFDDHKNGIDILPIGYRAIDMMKRSYGHCFAGLLFPSRDKKPTPQDIERATTDFLMKHLQDHDYYSVQLCTTIFKSVLQQSISCQELLLNPEPPIVDGYAPFFEPGRKSLLKSLAPLYVEQSLRFALAQAHTSEYAARMRAMDSATNNASDVLKKLNRSYNRTRQATITRELIEIVSGANALQQG